MALHNLQLSFCGIIVDSCVDAGIVECCDHCTGSGGNSSCFCDAICYTEEDCCYDISLLNCTEAISKCNYVCTYR